MNTDRRQTAQVCVALLRECARGGEIDDESHVALVDAVKHLQNQEFWQLQRQERHEGKNASTDQQLAICRIALPALEEAVQALNRDDFDTVIAKLELAATTDGTAPRRRRKKRP